MFKCCNFKLISPFGGVPVKSGTFGKVKFKATHANNVLTKLEFKKNDTTFIIQKVNDCVKVVNDYSPDCSDSDKVH